MGYYGKLESKKKAIFLRKKGYSYSQIQMLVAVSKSTLSSWCRDIKISKKQEQNLVFQRKNAAMRGSLTAAKNKIVIKQQKNLKIEQVSLVKLGKLSKRDRFVAGIALYLGDGYKTEHRFGFANANPQIIKFMKNWLLEFTDIKIEQIHGRIWLHDDLDETKAKTYWSELLNIKLDNFIKSYQVKNKTNSKKIRKNLHNYGVFSLIVNSKDLQTQMRAFMTGILLETR